MIDMLSNFSFTPTAVCAPSHTDPQIDNKRLAALTFHIQTGDYFRFHATLLGFIEETLAEMSGTDELTSLSLQLAAVRAARKDLCYLDEHYRIEPRQ